MCENTYDIIDWKSCASYSEAAHSTNNKNYDKLLKTPGLNADVASISDIVFPTLFHEDNETETSIVTLPDYGSECWPSGSHGAPDVPDDQMSVYQKVANWVSTQKLLFRKEEEHVLDDDDLEVIDPVDLFHESILDEYLLLAENDCERRVILRDLSDHRYHIESVEELMKTHEYKFIREPKAKVELELDCIVEFGRSEMEEKSSSKKRKKTDSACFDSIDEERILFLGVPRLLENYEILDREGYAVKLDEIPDLWLSPFEENLNRNNGKDEDVHSELEFLSSHFSEVYQTDCDEDEVRSFTFNTDILETVTVISVDSDEEVWLDAPEIPHWLNDEEPKELELFNQPSRPLYYYRDRIKGCYRIIGVEDETVVLFSGNDDDTIFYTEEKSCTANTVNKCESTTSDAIVANCMRSNAFWYSAKPSFVSKYRNIYNRIRYGKKQEYEVSDAKNDSGIDEDIDEAVCDDIDVPPFCLPRRKESVYYANVRTSPKRPSFEINPMKESFVECLFVVVGACIVFITLVLYKNDSPLFHMYRSKITEDVFNDINLILRRFLK